VTPLEWDGATYDRIGLPQAQWGARVLERLRPEGVQVVLDAGCGSGRVTEMLLQRLPDAHVVALDGSQRMLDAAAGRLAPAIAAGRAELLKADLSLPLPLDRPVDAVVSTSTFHWIADHDALFANLGAVLRPGGRLVAQCGGAGNVASVASALAGLGETWSPWNFSTPEDARRRLEASGFIEVETWLQEEPTPIEPGAALEEFLATVVLGAHVERRSPAEAAALVKAVAQALPGPVIDYVRLNLLATKAFP